MSVTATGNAVWEPTKTGETPLYAYYTVTGNNGLSYGVIIDKTTLCARCTCVHGSVWMFRKKNPGECYHKKKARQAYAKEQS